MSADKRVAVVVVHGIADQRPGQTLRELARLLCHGGAGEPSFVQGEMQEVLVPVTRLEPGPALNGPAGDSVTPQEPATAEAPRAQPGAPSGFYRVHTQAENEQTALSTPTGPQADLGIELNDYLLGRLVLSEEDALYATTRASLRRRRDDLPVDLYEMYWADQSRLGEGGLRALVSLYQLFINLSTLAADVVDQVSLSMHGGRSWRFLQRLYAWMAWLMKGPAVLVQLAMLLLMLSGMVAIVPGEQQTPLLVAVYGGGAIAAAVFAVLAWVRSDATISRWLKVLALMAGVAICIGLVVYVLLEEYRHGYVYIGTTLVLVAGLGIWLVGRYARLTRSVTVLGHTVVLATVAMLGVQTVLVLPYMTTLQEWMLTATLRTGEFLFAVILLVWAIFSLLQIVSMVLGFRLQRHGDAAVKASMDTARLTLVFSTGLFSVLSLVLWSVFGYVAGHALEGLYYESFIFGTGTWSSAAFFLDDRVRSLGSFFTPLVVASVSLGLLALLVLVPSLVEELAPTSNIDANGARPGAAQRAARLGRWLGRGLDVLGRTLAVLVPVGAIGGGALFLAFVIRQSALSFGLEDSWMATLTGWLDYFQGEALVTAGKWLAGGALTVAALGARFSNTFGRLRVAIDAVLDVDNYFADPPNRQPPRARIFSRYASLLAYLRSREYARIVIVSHSQGTVISAELLRYLHVQGRLATVVGDTPLALVTVGSPLRDLYAARFPLLYRWMGPVASDFDIARPHAADLGVCEWVNACRAGDYVGRYIWSPAAKHTQFPVAALDTQGMVTAARTGDRTEFCLGTGGHTRYFSNDALALGVEIERLVTAQGVEGGGREGRSCP